MTTNRMGLEQTLSDGELAFITETDHVQCGDASAMACELLAYRKASMEPVADAVAWNKPGEERKCDIRWRRFDVAPGPLFAAPKLQDVKVPEAISITRAKSKVINPSNAEAFSQGWNACRALMLKSITNEP